MFKQQFKKEIQVVFVIFLMFSGFSILTAEETNSEKFCFGVAYAGLLTTDDDVDSTLYANYEPAFAVKITVFFNNLLGVVLGGEFHSNLLSDNAYSINGEIQSRITYIAKGGLAFRLGPLTLYPMGGYGMGSPITRYEGSFTYLGAGLDLILKRTEDSATAVYFEYGNCTGTYTRLENVYFTEGYPAEKTLSSHALTCGVSSHF